MNNLQPGWLKDRPDNMWVLRLFMTVGFLGGTVFSAVVTPPDNKGLEFVLMFMQNERLGAQVFPLELYCTTQEQKPVHVHITSPKWNSPKIDETFTVTDGQVKKTLIDEVFRMTGSSISSKGILVQSDAEIACYGANKETLSNDVYLGLPVDALSTDYYAMAYSPASIKTELGIASTDDGTNVKVTLPSGNGPLDVVFKGKTYHAGDVINVPLGKYDTLQLQSTGDLTGAHVETNKPVAAFSGNVKTNVGNGTFQDHLVEQLVPSDRWGKQFVTAPIPSRTVGDVFKVVAREDNTVVNVPGQAPVHLNKGGVATFELPSNKYNYITSTKPIMIAQFVKSQQKPTEPADPSMMIIPPYEQFGSDYTFTTPEYSHPEYGNDPSYRYKNEFMIVTKKSDIQGLLLDGKPFPQTTWTDIPGTNLVGSSVTLPHGPHTVRHSNPLSTFGGYLYGHAYHESYGFPTGMRTAIIYSANCTPTVSVPGDGIDNDCDNKIDEELCPDNIDDDNDGKKDEDCVKTFPIDGLWGKWSSWGSQCSVTCGDGVRTRKRKCDSPAPKFGGKNCTGNDHETKSCYSGQPCGINIAAICAANRNAVVANPLNCAQYFDCAKKSPFGKMHLFECPYPQLFNNATLKCDDFENVNCGRRNEPMAPCEYEQNKCNGSDPQCKPCPQRLYSCVGVDDGRQPQSVFAPEYKDCKKNRTMGQGKCDFGFFNPQAHRCLPHNPGTLAFYCRQHKTEKLAIPTNCAKFYNCAKPGNSMASKTDECIYPKLFSLDTGECENFTTVQCKTRMEPQAPCEYDQYKCPPTNSTCKCPDEHADCRNEADGLEPWKGKTWGTKYAKCFKNRTLSQDKCPNGQYFHPVQKKCTDSVKPTEVKDVCQANPTMIFPDIQNCAKYIDCSARNSPLGNYIKECKYPQLYSTKTKRCENFENVHCDKRVEPQAPCDYEQNKCAKGNTTCSCPDNLPSCVGKSDGDHSFPTRMWKPDYIKCYKNRTILPAKRCTKGYFHPVQNKCMEDVAKTDANPYCKSNPHDVITMPDNCAQYINCSVVVTIATSSDPVQECKYPDLFSTQSMSCQDFTTVKCDKRMEPQAPCEYKQNLCPKGNSTCQRCVDRLPTCVGKTDGNHAFPVRMWKPDYVACTKNRTVLPTKKCTKGYFHPVQDKCMEDVKKPDAVPYCQANPTAVVQMSDNCARYINCSVVRSGGSSAADPIQECNYPDLFSAVSMTCQDFTTVQCKNRSEPKAPCEYKQNVCDKTDPQCVPCKDRLPTCVGKADGDQAFPTRMWKPDYVKCYKDRTELPTKKCTKGYFHPTQKRCLEDLAKPDAKSYCQSNPNDIVPLPDNCAQYIDCTVVIGGRNSSDPVKECQYPDLFSTLSMTCQHFTTVTCGKRMEPQAPCEYDQNKCAKGNTTCSCPDNLPSCVGKSDGDHSFPTRMWKPDYIKCYKNRTILPAKRCTKGYFHPTQEKCLEDVQKPDAKKYCQYNQNDIIPMADNCAQYINCTSVTMGTGSDPVQECQYPDLFSRQTKTCSKFQTVNCDKRREPMAPCEYEQNLCVNLKTPGCTKCPDRLPSCIGKVDGDQPFPTKLWSEHFIHCFKNRTVVDKCPSGAVFDPNTKTCTSKISKGNIDSYCQTYPTAIKTNPLNCAQYYNCSDNSASLGHHLEECKYPDLFSEATKRCERFESVHCTNRSEPQAPCDYMQNLCQQSDPTCVRCPNRLPSCVGMSDGNHAFPSRTWKPDYITCYKNRTVNVTKCATGYFHPTKQLCTIEVTKPDAKPYCQSNQKDVVPLPNNCAQFIDCTLYISGNSADPAQECHYPDLFSTNTLRCEQFESVTCDKRKEPMAPCQYEKNLCSTNDPTCVPCQDRLPSCIAVTDGSNAFPNKLWKPDYITCYKNRTNLPINQCRNGYFHPVQKQCASDVSKVDAKPYCQANPHDVVPMSNNCAHFIDCADVLAAPSSDPVSECTYPDLFSTVTMVCQSFTTVTCDIRPEPQAPCEYDQNVCKTGNTSCEQCPKRLPSCIGLTDGAQPFPTKLWTSNFVQCYKNRTVAITHCQPGNVFDPGNQACVSDVPKSRMDSYCKANPGVIKVDPDNCAQYYNCSNTASLMGHYKQECKYPDLFSSTTQTCQPFNIVNCQTRREPKAPCEYEQNLCKPNDTKCEPCPDRLPSCIGKSDGDHAFPPRMWKEDYIVCNKERTVAEKKCSKGYFHPSTEKCTEKVQPKDAKPYCTANPSVVIPVEDNCAQLINCTALSSGATSDPIMECPYPQLFSGNSMTCQDFTTVTCDNRTEPQSPCEYKANRCDPNDQACVPCVDRLPSCKGLTDGDHAFPTRLWKPQYVSCYSNRTEIPTKKCSKGYFHPTKRVCTEKIDNPDAVQYCQANPGDMLPVERNCAKYYKCSASLVGQDVVQECHYPDLFSTLSMTCQDFTTVHCDNRSEPQAPCEYDQNKCPAGQTCEPCPDRLPSCVGLQDGDQPAAGHRWMDLYVRCYKNRTTEVKHCPTGAVFNPNRLACVSKIKSGDISSFCQANPQAIKAHETNCAQYYNCSNPSSSLGSYLQECKYPDLFSSVTLQCDSFESVPCGTRHEPMAPCDYLQNLCNGSDPMCRPCQERLPSCVGLANGNNAISGKEWTSDYVECNKNRTVSVKHCQTGYFNPVTKSCTEQVKRGVVKDFCKNNPTVIVAASDDCAQYYNCSQRTSQIGDYIGECKYPSLFSTFTMTCGSFRRTFCDARPEPQAPCQYEQNRCSQSDPNCTPCPERLPSCIGLPDGAQPHPNHPWSEKYIECFSNRTMAVKTCKSGYFHPRQHQCRSKVNPVDIPEYCKIHVIDVITNPDNCAVYYNCSSSANGHVTECKYPDLYDTNLKICRDFSQVACQTRPEPKAPCQYTQNICQANDTSCVPCQDRLPSCVGLPDGDNPVPTQLWGQRYVTCYHNRTTNVSKCDTGYFHPKLRKCVTTIDKPDIGDYCAKHSDAILPNPDNCAQYVNCSEVTAQTVKISECTYPDLFSADTLTCTRFTRVLCDKRMEPQAPCEYDQNKCALGDTSCSPCPQRLPSCIGSPNGARPFTGLEWTENYVECYKNRTMALDKCPIGSVFDSIDLSCASNINKNAISSFCRFNKQALQEHPDNCAQYFNCSMPGSPLGPFLMECDYPKLFSSQRKTCMDFESAQCDNKKEPQRPCDYLNNLCAPQDLACTPCQSRFPSCVGLSDGSQAYPGRTWQADYMKCYKNRTTSVEKCLQGYFHPQQRACVEKINQVNIVSYCQVHTNDIVTDPSNCAKYFNCSDPSSNLGPYQLECKYPDLYSPSVRACMRFDSVDCKNRPEPVSPCEYSKNLCDPSDTVCTPCTNRFPSCKGLPDGKNPAPGPLWREGYIVCEMNRTMSVDKCKQGLFNPRTKSCENQVSPVYILQYCQAHPRAVLPVPDTCSQYYDCPHILVTSGEVSECKYPDLFSKASLKCERFETVDCDSRNEPQAPCEYSKNICPANDLKCVPCPARLPSCVGLPNGPQTFASQEWATKYVDCYKNRTVAINQCPKGSYFNPTSRRCTQNVNQVDIPSFCRAYPTAVRPHPTNCAQYYDCSTAAFGGSPNRECPYPQLFDAMALICKPFTDVQCGVRYEPKAPCEYKANRCSPSQPFCIPCTSRKPSCIGLGDGSQPFPGQPWQQQFVVCNKDRTANVSRCQGTNIFNPSTRKCIDKQHITKPEIIDYCKAYPNAVLPDPDDCSRFYRCSLATSPGTSSHQQCTYPDLFSPADSKCIQFDLVQCGSRPEPTAPCQYDHNKCPVNDNSCIPCQIRLPDCTGLPDGDDGIPGMLWSVNYVMCGSNRTVNVNRCPQGVFDPNIRACSTHVGPQHVREICYANPRAVVPHPTNCAQYFDCSKDNTPFGHYLLECDYPMLFDERSLQCRNFFDVNCGTRSEPKAPCKYFQNICPVGNNTCKPCVERHPSCIGQPDGNNAIPGHAWSKDYMTCSKDRTLSTHKCPTGHFDPSARSCSSSISPVDIPNYCKSNPTAVLPDPSNCGKFFNCSDPKNNYRHECTYPLLFSDNTSECDDFQSVFCGQRPEPQTLCDYSANQCTSGINCIPCQDKLPSCKGLPDGINPIPGKLWSDQYIQCLKNRTLVKDHCNAGVFDPTVRKCVENVDPSKINQVCQANHDAIFPDPNNCAKYYDCKKAPGIGFGVFYQEECTYPELFSTVSKSCQNFATVRCSSRPEPQAPCEYTQNQCKGSFSCQPCSNRLPSCVGSQDGANAYPGHKWTSDYIVCLKNRTLNITHCSNSLIFDPISRKCVKFVEPAHVPDYCKLNPRAVFPNTRDAAQYYDCANPSSPVGVRHLQECNYPDLFDTQSLRCRDFTTVPTDQRPVPQAPCEYRRNICTSADPGCTPCPQRLHSCVGLPDGPNAIEGKQWTPDYVTCRLNRTTATKKCNQGVFDPNKKQCEIPPTSGPVTIQDQCKLDPSRKIPYPGSCSLYYNCSKTVATFGPILPAQLDECEYPDLYSTVYQKCLDFQYVQCDNRHEVKAPCQYLQNQCSPNDPTCAPCPERLPSCIGLPDGNNAIIGRYWSRDYIHCYKERTLGVEQCQNGVFNPNTRRCDNGIDNGNVDDYCKNHPNDVVADSNDCAKYFDCSKHAFRIGVLLPGDSYLSKECHYPDLFSTITMKCEPFNRVTCDKRKEPQAPCKYEQNICPPGDTTCVPCDTRLPSCVGLPDGHVAIPGREYSGTYLDCKQNRTLSVDKCKSGFFDAGLRMCVTKINSANIAPYCKSNTGAVLPHPTNCAWYYNCSVTGRTLQSVYPYDIEYVQECKYPDLFSSATMKCEHFQSVSCSGHFEPQAPCEYFKNRCDPSAANCIPCPNRLPSCKGLPNGRQTITNLYDGLRYLVDCSLNRTMSYELCTSGNTQCAAATTPLMTTQAPATTPFFPPIQTQPTTAQPSVCTNNYGRLVPNPQHCGQYYNCTKTTPPFLFECPYPEMFNEFTGRCQDFRFVSCNARPEFKAPCEYQQNICAAGDLACISCAQRLPSCRNLADGNHPFPGREGTASYITCLKGRTMGVNQCTSGVFDINRRECSVPTTSPVATTPSTNSGDPNTYCKSHPYDMIEDPNNCAKYYDCRDIFTTNIITAKECPYPLLYHSMIHACADFNGVNCKQRHEPQAPCEYSENQCHGPNCVPCSQRFVSCVGLSDGNHPYPGQPSKYVRCQRNRTIAVEQCSFGVFDATSGQCRMAPATLATVATTKPATISSYCQTNPQAVIPDTTNCARYYMCNNANTPLGNYLMECPYPQLFDQLTLTCRDRVWVQCGQRKMPTSQCDYKLYQCIGFDCQRCPGQIQTTAQTLAPPQTPRPTNPFVNTPAQTAHPTSGPTCTGLPDGLNPYPGRELTDFYIVCSQGRLIETGICIINKILDPVRRRCTDPANPDVIDAYCKANPGVTIPSVTNCAQFYHCGNGFSGSPHELQECGYPQLFSTIDHTCKQFSQVQCGQLVEPITPCEYRQYQCDSSNPNCIPCEQRMPSCKGKPDGLNPYPNTQRTADYIECDNGRTTKIDKCTVGFFDPVFKQCRMI